MSLGINFGTNGDGQAKEIGVVWPGSNAQPLSKVCDGNYLVYECEKAE